jgi:hypothetical protein
MDYQPLVVQPCVYVLKLECDKYYIGITYNINLQYAQHLSGIGAKWTRLYKPLCILEIIIPGTIDIATRLFDSYKLLYGDSNVSSDSVKDVVDIEKDNKSLVMTNDSSSTSKVKSSSVKVLRVNKELSDKCIIDYNKEPDIDPDTDRDVFVKKEEVPVNYAKIYRETLTEVAQETKKTNDAKGLDLSDILTKENLHKWLNEEKRSYAYIAKNYAGCSNKEVSTVAKEHGFTTPFTSKRRYMLSMKGGH